MSKILDVTNLLKQLRRNYSIVDDCDDITSGGKWTNVNTGSGAAIATVGAVGGQLTLTSGGTAANISLRAATNPSFLPSLDCPVEFGCRLSYTEAATNKANIFAGFSSAFPAETLQATNLGPLASFSGVGFFKQGGNTNWSVICSNGTTQTIVNLTALLAYNKAIAVAGGGAWQSLKVEITNVTATTFDAVFTLNNIVVYKISGFIWTSMAAMSPGLEVKAGAASSEILTVDYQYAEQERFSGPF